MQVLPQAYTSQRHGAEMPSQDVMRIEGEEEEVLPCVEASLLEKNE
jgi:hypothetical protein